MSTSTFHYPPYNRFSPWREDADYRVAVVSPVGTGPRGEDGQDLTWESMSDADKQNLADKIQDKLNKGDKGDTGDSAYDVAGGDQVWGNVENWLESLKGADGAFSMLDEDSKEAAAAALAPMVIDVDWGEYVAEHLDDIVTQARQGVIGNIYPVGALYFTMADLGQTGPSILGFPGEWEQLEDRFLYASAEASGYTSGNENGEISLQPEQVPLRNHRHAAAGLTFDHVHNEGKDTIVRPFQIRTSGYMQRQAKVGSSNAWITSFTRQSTPSAEGYNHNDNYDGRSIIFNHLRRNTDNASTAKQTLVKTYGPIAPISQDAAGNGTSKTGIDGNTSYTSIEATQSVNIMPPYITVHVWKRKPDPVTSESQESNSESDNEGEN